MSVDDSLEPVFENKIEKMLLGIRDILIENHFADFYFSLSSGLLIANPIHGTKYRYEWRSDRKFPIKGEVPQYSG